MGEMQLEFNINQQIITRLDANDVVANSKNYLYAKFSFSEEWEGVDKTAVFRKADIYSKGSGTTYSVLLEDNMCKVPHEVISDPMFLVSVFGGERITANRVEIPVLQSGYAEGETPAEPTPTVYEQILEKVEGIEQLAQDVVEGESSREQAEQERAETFNTELENFREETEILRGQAEQVVQDSQEALEEFESNSGTALAGFMSAREAVITEFNRESSKALEDFATQSSEELEKVQEATDKANNAVDNMSNTFAGALKGTASGEVVSISDVSPIEHNMAVNVESENLFKPTNYTKGTLNASTGVAGEASSVKSFTLTTDYIYLKSGDYVVSNITGANLRYVAFYNTDKEFKSATWTNRVKTFKFTITENCYVRIDIETNSVDGVQPKIENFDTFCDEYQFMLEKGTVKTPYRPYVDISTVKLDALGKNLINFFNTTKVQKMNYNTSSGLTSKDGFLLDNLKVGKYYTASLGFKDNTNICQYVYFGKLQPDTNTLVEYVYLTTDKVNKTTYTFIVEEGYQYWIYRAGTYTITQAEINKFSSFQFELGESATPYEPYIAPITYTPNADGIVEGVKSIYPNTTLVPSEQGVLVECEYNRDLNKAFEEITNAIIALGGNF